MLGAKDVPHCRIFPIAVVRRLASDADTAATTRIVNFRVSVTEAAEIASLIEAAIAVVIGVASVNAPAPLETASAAMILIGATDLQAAHPRCPVKSLRVSFIDYN